MSYGRTVHEARREAEAASREFSRRSDRVLLGAPDWLRREFPAHVALLDESGFALLVNRTWGAWWRWGRLDRELMLERVLPSFRVLSDVEASS